MQMVRTLFTSRFVHILRMGGTNGGNESGPQAIALRTTLTA